jgi:hypothetical protein
MTLGTDDPRKRKAHVKRIFISDPVDPETGQPTTGSTDPPGTPTDTSIWVDVLRIDGLFVWYKALDTGKTTATRYVFNWDDDPDKHKNPGDAQQEKANPARKSKQLMIHDPDDYDPQDLKAGTIIPLWLIEKTPIEARGGGQPGVEKGATQRVNWVFNNLNPLDPNKTPDKPPAKRKVTAVTVANNSLTGTDGNDLEMTTKDSQGNTVGKVVDWDTYFEALKAGTTDDSQKVDVELLSEFSIAFGPDLTAGIKGQTIKYALTNNKDIKEATLNSDGSLLFKKVEDTTDTSKPPPLRLDPLQMIVNVSWLAQDFVIRGSQGTNTDHLTNYIICSKNGKDWYKPEIQKLEGFLAYANGVWMLVQSDSSVQISKDKFKTWKSMQASGLAEFPVSFLAGGLPKKPAGSNDKPKVRFVVFGGDRQSIKWASTDDLGDTWTIDKEIQTSGASDIGYYQSGTGLGFLTFLNGAFYTCAAGYNGYGTSNEPTSTATFTTTMWKSADGAKWDSSEVVPGLGKITVFDEAGFPDPMYAQPYPCSLCYVKADKEKGTDAKYILSGFLYGIGTMYDLWYSEASDPTGCTGYTRISGNFAAIESAYDPRHPPPVVIGPVNADYYRAATPVVVGGSSAAVKSHWAVRAQHYEMAEDSISYAGYWAGDLAGAETINTWLNVSGEKEGVVADGGEHYFTNSANIPLTGHAVASAPKPEDEIPFTVQTRGANFYDDGIRSMASNGSVMVWLKVTALESSNPDNFIPPFTNKGLEIWYSKNGSDWTKADLPLDGPTMFAGDILTGAAPPKPKGQ